MIQARRNPVSDGRPARGKPRARPLEGAVSVALRGGRQEPGVSTPGLAGRRVPSPSSPAEQTETPATIGPPPPSRGEGRSATAILVRGRRGLGYARRAGIARRGEAVDAAPAHGLWPIRTPFDPHPAVPVTLAGGEKTAWRRLFSTGLSPSTCSRGETNAWRRPLPGGRCPPYGPSLHSSPRACLATAVLRPRWGFRRPRGSPDQWTDGLGRPGVDTPGY